ncbi:MAG: serine/threonine protein kinase [Nannocystales bacterium]
MSDPLETLHEDLRSLVGQTVAGRYRVEALIGVGGMAAVFRAHHEGLHRDLAVKVLHPNLSANTEMSARFEREARSASRLDHPNCVQVTDFGSTDDGMMYMVMQLLEGAELTGMLGKPIAAPRSVELILQILRGLEHAHANGVVHRDVKPENVFVTQDHEGDEVLKLVDFGIAKLTDATTDTHKTSAGLVFGTPAYMSPEQAMGVEADSRADLYSTGILFYQMLSGRLPIDNDDPVALVRMQVAVDPDPLPASVPPVIAGVAQRLLEKDRDRRFQTATEVIETLESIELMLLDEHVSDVEITVPGSEASATGVEMLPPAVVAPTPPPSARPPMWKWAAAAGVLVLVMGSVALFRGDDDDSAEVTETRTAVSADSRGPARPIEDDGRGPSAEVLDEVDILLSAKSQKKAREAEALLTPLREEFPNDATLLWRQGRALALQTRKSARALEVYGEAVEADPELLEDRLFYAQLHDLLRNGKIRTQAIAFSLKHHGDYGDNFLLETVNDEKDPIQYDARHEVLDNLTENPDNVSLINERLNRALDVMQAADASAPCKSYAAALDSVMEAPEYYFYNRVEKARVPEAPAEVDPGSKDDLELCGRLPARRDEVLAELATHHPDAGETDGEIEILDDSQEAPPPAPDPASKPKAKKKKKKSSPGPDCNRFGAALTKKCRNK